MKPFRHHMLARAIRHAVRGNGAELNRSTRTHKGKQLTLGALLSGGAVNLLAATHNVDAVDAFTDVEDLGGNVEKVISKYKKGSVGVNVFNDFVVGDLNTVNLELDTDVDQLVNIVRNSRPEVHGVLNSYKDGTLGGNVVFASSYGFLVGASGVINVGQLSVRTPSQTEIDSWLDVGTPDFSDAGITALANDDYSVSASGLVTISGKVNTADGIDILANEVVVDAGAVMTAGNAIQAIYVDAAMVNVGDFTAPTALQVEGGTITIVAEGDTTVGGDLMADGGITISAADIVVASGATIDARDDSVASEAATTAMFVGDNVSLAGDVLASDISIIAEQTVTVTSNLTALGSIGTEDDENEVVVGIVDVDAPQFNLDAGSDALILAATIDESAVTAAGASDMVIVGEVDAFDSLDASAGSIEITADNVVSGSDVALHASDIQVSGSLTADATAADSLGQVVLDGDANYDDLGNISANRVKVVTSNDFYLTSDASSVSSNSGDLVWEETSGAIDLGFALELEAQNLQTTSGLTISAEEIVLTAGNALSVGDQLAATGEIRLSGNTLDFDFSQISADILSLVTSNNMVFAAAATDSEYVAAGADDFKLVGAVDFDGELNLSAGAISVTSGNSITADNISFDSADTQINGSAIADAGDSDSATFGTITLEQSARYADLGNLSYSELALVTDATIVLSDNASDSAVTGAAAGDIVWVDSGDFDFSGSDISFSAGTLALTTDTSVSADNITLEVDTFDTSGTLNATGDIILRSSIDDSLDLSGLNAAKLTLDSDDLTWTKSLVYGGDLELVADTITVSSATDITAANITLDGDTISVSGSLSTGGGDITIDGRKITLHDGSHLDATGVAADGDVTITASDKSEVGYGTASATSSITLSGEIDAANITAKAESIAISSMYAELGTTLGVKTVAQLLGVEFNYMEALADATVTVTGTADLNATDDITLASESHAMSESLAAVLGGAPAGVALAGIYSHSDASSTTEIQSGAIVHAGQDLSVTAHNEAYVAASAFVIQAQNSNKAVVAASVAEGDVNATARIENGADLDATNLVLSAENLNRFYSSSSVYGLTGTRYGIAVAVGDFDTNATAEMGADIGSAGDKVGNVTVTALDRTVEQRVHSGVKIGAGKLLRMFGSRLIKGASKVQSGASGLLTKYLPESTESPEDNGKPGEVEWKGGLALSLNLSDHEAYAYLGNNVSGADEAPTINASGDVLVAAGTDLGTDNDAIIGGDGRGAVGGDQGGYRTTAQSSISSPKKRGNVVANAEKSAALAFNFAINEGEAVAEVGDYVTVNARNLGVVAEQKMPIVSTYDRWDTMSDIKNKFSSTGGLESNILTTFANSGASADKEAYGGTVNVVWNDIDTKAWIGDNATVITTGTGSWSAERTVESSSGTPGILDDFEPFKTVTYTFDFDESVSVRAFNLIESANVAGNIGSLGLIPNANGTNEEGKSVGGSIVFVQQNADAVAGIGESTITAAGDISITAETDERHFVVTPSSGWGAGTGFNGAIAVLNSEALTHASLSNRAFVTADDLVIVADHQMGNWAAGGAVNWTTGESAVGVAIAVNITQGDTKAFIGDNSKEEEKVSFKNDSQPAPDAPSAPIPTERAIVARNVEVRSKSSGTNGSLATAGALLQEHTDEPGMSTKLKGWLDGKTGGLASKISSKLSGKHSDASSSSSSSKSSVNQASSDASNGSSSDSSDSVAEVDADATSFAGAGSVTVSVSNLDAKSIVEGANIRAHSGTGDEVNLDIQALQKIVSASASGSAAVNLSQSPSTPNSQAMAGAIAYQITFNDALAWLVDSTVVDAGDVAVQALHGGDLTSIGLALAVDKPSQGGKSTSAGLSISGAMVRDGTSARIEGSSISSSEGGDEDLEVTAYNNTDVGVGGGTLYAGGQQGFGLAITYADIDDPADLVGDSNPDGNNIWSSAYNEDVYSGKAVEAVVTDYSGTTSEINDFQNIDISARGLQRIGIGAAGVGYNDNAENAFGFMGSFAIGSIRSDSKALLENVDITSADTVSVNVAGSKDGSLDSILDGLGSSSVNDDYDFSGASAFDNTEVHTSDDGSGSAYNYGTEGERIIAVAGVVQVGKSNLGISYAHADVSTEKTAQIRNAYINEVDTAASSIDVNARDEALLYTVAIGVGVATGKYSGIGSVAVNSLNNTVKAEIGDWNGSVEGVIHAEDVAVTAQNDMDAVNVAGAVGVSTGSGAAGGLAVALNLVGDSGHETRARIGNIDLEVSDDITVKASSGSDGDENLLVGNAIGIGASTGGSGLAFAGAIGVTDVDQTIQAGIKNVGENSDGSATNSGGTIRVQSADYTDSVSTAWMGAGSSSGSAGGIALAVNRIDSDVTAEILGDDSSDTSTVLAAKHVYVDALRDNWLLTIDAGVAASKQISVAPSIGTGVVDGNVTARVADKADIDAYGNVGVEAQAHTENLVGSGAVGVGLNGGAGAIAISTAAEYGKTQAYIEDATVKALGLGGTFNILDGELTGMTALPDLSATEEDGDGNSNAVGNSDVSMDDLTTAFGSQKLSEGNEAVTGVAVNATSFVKQQAITVGGSGSKNVAITANVATNVFESSTDAYIKNSTINSGVSGTDTADVVVRGSSHDYGLGVSAGIAISGGGSGIGGFSTNHMGKEANAEIDNSTIDADELVLEANSTQLAQAVSAGIAAGVGAESGLGGAASVTINKMMGGTKAWLHDSTITATDVVVNAERRQDVNSAAGSAGIGTNVGIGFGLAVNLVGGDSTALIGNDLDDSGDDDTTLINADTVTVDADRLQSVNSYSLGAGLSTGFGVAAMINVTEFKGETRAAVHGLLHDNGTSSNTADDYFTTQIIGQDGTSDASSVTVNAQEILDVDQETLGIGAGNSVGVGAVANVVLGRSQVYSEVVGTDIDATLLDIDATAQREAWMISMAGGASTNVGAAVSIGVALFGQGDTTTEDGTNAEDEFDPSRQTANNVLAEDTAGYNPHLSSDDIAAIEDESGSTIEASTAPSTSTTTESGNSLKIGGESVVAARISGGDIDVDTLDVDAQTMLFTYQGLGAVSLGSVAISGAVGVTRLYDMTIATVDTDLTANDVTVDAQVMNVSDEDAAGEMKSWVISGGGTGVTVNYNDVRSELRTVAGVSSATGDSTGDISVAARDTTELRVGDLDAGNPSDPTEGSLSVTVGAGAIGASIGFAEKNSDVDAWLGETGKAISGYNTVELDAYSAGLVKTSAFALAGGLLAGVQGVVTDARDESNVNATVHGTIDADAAVNIDAQATPEVFSRAYGVTVAAGGAMGGSFSYAIADTKAVAEAGDGTYFTGNADVNIRAETGDGSREDYVSADANAFAASGGLLAGVAGSEALAENSSQAVAKVGDGVRIPDNDFGVYARNTAVQYADADGYFVGLFAGGFNWSTAESSTSARVEYGSNPISNAVLRTGDFILDAYNYDENQSFTTAGGGGYYAGSAAVSNANSYNNSNSNKSASVEIADWASGYTAVPVLGGEVRLSAAHESQFFSGVDSTTVSVVGGSGAEANSDIDNDVEVTLGNNVSFEALQIEIEADNSALQIQDPAESGFSTSINAGAGGAANGSAGLSYQDLTGVEAAVTIGNNAVLAISDLAWLDSTYDHGIAIDAHTRFYVYDAAVLKVGGALQGAGSESDVDATTKNTVTIGDDVVLYNPIGEIGIGTYTTGSATAQAETSVWAVAGVAGGVSDVNVNVTNTVDIGQDVIINALDDIGIYAGRGSSYLYENQLVADARTNVYNWTAVPIPAGNDADADINVTNTVIFGDDIDLGSDSHVTVEANEGSLYANADGVERNPYLELFSTETTFGSNDTSSDNTLVFEGSGSVVAGQNAYQWVDVDDSGNITSDLAGYGSAGQLSGKYSSRASLQAYIDELQALVDEYEAWTESGTSNEGGKTDGNEDTGDTGSGGTSTEVGTGSSGENPYTDEIVELKTEIAALSVVLDTLSEQENNVIAVTDISASAGNVSLLADTIDLQGASNNRPEFIARGDAYIDINNRDDQHLLVGNLYIANQTGGNVYVTGGASLDEAYITEEDSSTTGVSSGIHIVHNPGGTNYLNSDVIIDGAITNLLSTVDITLEEGDLLQQASIEANTINLTVENGSLVVNAGNSDVYYGRAPSSLVNFVDKWKPEDADDFVQYWINHRYEDDIDATGIDEFNNWFYSCATAKDCYIGGVEDNSEDPYYAGDYDTVHVFFNWGFSDSQEYDGADQIRLKFKKDSDSRGGRNWRFQPVEDKQGNLIRTASYNSVKSDIGSPGSTIVGEKVVINARRVDINGTIEVGTDNNWSVSVGSGFDSAIAQYISLAGLSSGDQIELEPGQTLRVENPNYVNIFVTPFEEQYIYIDPQISKVSGAESITLTYDVASGQLLVDDVPVSGGGYLSINAKISSTGADGNILVRDGLGQIDIDNNSNTELVINSLDAGDDAVGIVRITDYNFTKNMNDGGSSNDYFSHWYVHSPGGQIQEYETTSYATSYEDGTFVRASGGTGTTSSTTYDPLAGQLYYIREDASVSRSYTDFPDGYLAKYPNTVGEWQGTGAGGALEWNVEASYYTTCASNPDVCTNGTATNYIRQEYDADSISRYWWAIGYSYDSYYGSNWTDTDPSVYIPYYLNMETHTYVKADHSIGISFTGVATGSIDIDSAANVSINGNIYNPLGTTDINTSGSLGVSSGAAFDAETLRLYAGQGDLGSLDDPLNIATNTVSLDADGGSVYFDITGKSGAVQLEKFHALYDIVGSVDKGLEGVGTGTHIQGDTLDLVSYSGSIGSAGTIGTSFTYDYINVDLNEITLEAADDIVIYQASGDLAVNTISASEDVVITLGDGSLVNGIGQNEKTDEELAYLQTVWDRLGLQDADAGEIAVTGYENQFTSKYHTYWLIKQRLSDSSAAGFTIDAAFEDTFMSRYGVSTVAEATQLAKDEYFALEDWFADQVAAPDVYANEEDAIGVEQKGTLQGYDYGDLLTSSYDAGYALVIDEASAWYADLIEGAQWSQSQLDISINAAALNADAQATLTNREANIVAPNLDINVSGGSVGEDLADLVFVIDRDNPTITDAQKIALLEAGPGDIETSESGSLITFNVSQVDPIKIDTTGVLNVAATDEIYAESASGLTLGSIVSTDGNVRLAVNGAIDAISGTNISANDLYLANTQGDIGSVSNRVQVDLDGVLRQAGAANNLYLTQVGGDLVVDAVSAGGIASLVSNADIYGLDSESVVSGSAIQLVAGDDLGSNTQALNLRMSGGGDLDLNADNAWLNIAGTSEARLGASLSGILRIDASGNLVIDGGISAPELDLYAAGDILDSGAETVTVTNLAKLSADNIDVDAVTFDIGSGDFDATAGAMTLGDITTAGDLDLLATGDMQLNGDLDIAYTTASSGGDARLLADAQSITMAAGKSIRSEEDIQLTAVDSLNLQSLIAGGDINLTALNLLDTTLGDIDAVYLQGDNVYVDAGDALTLVDVAASGVINLDSESLLVTGDLLTDGNVVATAGNGLEVQGDIGSASSKVNSINLQAGLGGVTLGGSAFASGQFLANAGNDFSLAAASLIDASSIDVTARAVTANAASQMSSSSSALFTLRGGDSLFGGVTTSTDLTLDSDSDITFASDVTTGSNLRLETLGDVFVSDGVTLDVGHNLRGITTSALLAQSWQMAGSSQLLVANNAEIDTDGAQVFETLSVTGNLTQRAGDDVTFDANTNIGGRLHLTGDAGLFLVGDLSVGTASASDLTLLLGGSVAQSAGQTSNVSGAVSVEALAWTTAANSALQSGSGSSFEFTAAGSASSFGLLVSGGDLAIDSTGDIDFLNDVTVGSNVSDANLLLNVAGDVSLADAATLLTYGNWQGIAEASARVGSFIAGSGSLVDTRDAMNVVAQQGIDFALLDVANSAQLRAGGDIQFSEAADFGSSLSITDGNHLNLVGDVTVGSAGAANANLNLRGDVSQSAAETFAISGDLTASANSWSMGAAALLQSGGAMQIDTVAGMDLAQVDSGSTLALTSGAEIALRESMNAVDSITLQATDAITLSDAAQLVSSNSLSVDSDSFTMGAGASLQVATDFDATTTNEQHYALVDVDGNAVLTAGGDIAFSEAANIGADLTIVDGDNLAMTDHVAVTGTANLTLRGDVTQSAGQQFTIGNDLTASANSWSMGDTALLQSGGAMQIDTVAGMDLAQVDSGSTLALTSGAEIALRESMNAVDSIALRATDAITLSDAAQLVSGNSLSVDSDSFTMGAGASLQVAADFDATTTNEQHYSLSNVDGNSVLTAGGDIAFSETANIGADLTIVDGDNLAMTDDVAVTGTANLTLRGDVTQSAGQQFTIGNDLTASANSWSMGDTALLQSGGAMQIDTVAGMDLAQVDSGSTLALTSGAEIALRETMNAVDSITLQAVDAIILSDAAQLVSGNNLSVISDSFTMGTGASLQVAADFDATTTNEQRYALVDVDGNAVLTAGGDIAFSEAANIGSDLTIVDGDNLAMSDHVAVTGTANLTLRGDVTQSAGQQFTIGNDLTASANSWTMGDTALLQSGGAMQIDTVAGMDLAQVDSGSTLALTSGAEIALRESMSAVDSITLQAADAITLSDAAQLVSGNNLSVDSDSFTMGTAASLQVAADFDATTTNEQHYALVDVDGNAVLTAGGDIAFSEAANIGADLTIVDGDNLAMTDDVAVTGTASLTLRGDVTQSAGQQFTIGNDLTASANSWRMGDAALLQSGGAMQIDTIAGMDLAQVDSGSTLALTSGAEIALRESMNAVDSITLQAADAITLSDAAQLVTGSNL
uniref:leukotoxin LktA family filamentous adhesin n=1 Tax=Microbulbifer agarilyticus TaxID=260552 RepID=UPI00025594CF